MRLPLKAPAGRNLRVLSVFGTRPEATKMAPVVQAVDQAPDMESLLLVTAQHRELLDQVLLHFGLHPDGDLDVMTAGQSLLQVTTRVLEGCVRELERLKPDLVLVHGDTQTSFACALAAFWQGLPVGHVEAGLRTDDLYNPFPEEANRRLTDRLSLLHFAPTARAAANLRAEGLDGPGLYITGNTAIDALKATVSDGHVFTVPGLERVDWSKRVILAETHRRENFGVPMREIVSALRDVTRRHADVELVYSVHPNPNASGPIREILANEPRVHLFDPPSYPDWANMQAKAWLVATDSGGLQEEAPSLGTPVVVLRGNTERPEALEAGTAVLAGTTYRAVLTTLEGLLTQPSLYERMAHAANPFGDGKAADRIVAAIRHAFGLAATPPEPFRPH